MITNTGTPRVLVVDDEEHITELLSMGLSMAGFEVERTATGRAALAAIERQRPDLVVLDVMLPDLDGFTVAKRLRQTEGAGTRVPVIFLTARDTTADKIEGLRLGSDDYMTKPFSVEELIERVKAVLRRASGIGPSGRRLSFEDLEMDQDTREVWRAGNPVELTPTEYKLGRNRGHDGQTESRTTPRPGWVPLPEPFEGVSQSLVVQSLPVVADHHPGRAPGQLGPNLDGRARRGVTHGVGYQVPYGLAQVCLIAPDNDRLRGNQSDRPPRAQRHGVTAGVSGHNRKVEGSPVRPPGGI